MKLPELYRFALIGYTDTNTPVYDRNAFFIVFTFENKLDNLSEPAIEILMKKFISGMRLVLVNRL